MSPTSLSVVIPAFNEAARLPQTLARVHAHLAGLGQEHEIVVVDDGSSDDTAGVVRDAGAPVELLSYARNRGKGAALRAGVAASRGELVLVSVADLSTPIEEVVRLERELAGADVAIGSRAVGGARITERQPFWREWSGRAFNAILRLLAVSGFRDTQCGFKLSDFRCA